MMGTWNRYALKLGALGEAAEAAFVLRDIDALSRWAVNLLSSYTIFLLFWVLSRPGPRLATSRLLSAKSLALRDLSA